MPGSYDIFIWKKAPFLRLLIPVISGIILQFYLQVSVYIIAAASLFLLTAFFLFSFLPEVFRFRFRMIQGILISLFLIAFGSFITWQKDIRHHSEWYGKFMDSGSYIVATINEPPIEKAKSFKALANVQTVINKGTGTKTEGNIFIYFAKDSASQKLKYGNQVIVNKLLSPILNSGNPAAFDYKQYAAFRQLFHQVYLRKNEWVLLSENNKKTWPAFVFSIRAKVVSTLEKYLGKGDESSIAKALLIGYKVDLDKDLIQAYSNAGVVHLIAISGLHIGIIYAILMWLFSVLPFTKRSKFLRLFLTIGCLWLFALLTGASASVVRAAIMFSFIIIGNSFNKKSSVYNSIAASVFLLLCYNPFILFDVGFQLSYLAVLGIVIAQKPISNWFYFKNRFLRKIWLIASVSFSAQLFTFPLSFYYFHQMPLLFLFSNMLAIPLATFALCGALILLLVSPISIIAFIAGKLEFGIIWLLNHTVLFFDAIPFALWNGVSLSVLETILLYGMVCCILFAFIRKNKKAFKFALAFSFIFCFIKSIHNWQLYSQKRMIVYNIPTHKAIEFIDKNRFKFIGDSSVIKDKNLNNFNLKPAHIAFNLVQAKARPERLFIKDPFYQFFNLRILMIDSSLVYYPQDKKTDLDLIILSKNAPIKLHALAQNFNCKKYIFDASNPAWKIEQWKKECEELHLHFYSVPEQGAFVINL